METATAVYSIPHAEVSIYAVDENGVPTGAAVWSSLCHNQIQVTERYTEKITYPTGVKYGVTHHINEEHEISIRALMDLSYGAHRNTRYVLFISWLQSDLPESAEDRKWIARTYYHATYKNLDVGGQDADASMQGSSFRSQFFRVSSGTGSVEAPGA